MCHSLDGCGRHDKLIFTGLWHRRSSIRTTRQHTLHSFCSSSSLSSSQSYCAVKRKTHFLSLANIAMINESCLCATPPPCNRRGGGGWENDQPVQKEEYIFQHGPGHQLCRVSVALQALQHYSQLCTTAYLKLTSAIAGVGKCHDIEMIFWQVSAGVTNYFGRCQALLWRAVDMHAQTQTHTQHTHTHTKEIDIHTHMYGNNTGRSVQKRFVVVHTVAWLKSWQHDLTPLWHTKVWVPW